MHPVVTFYAKNELRNYSYLMLDEKSGDAWVIDPYEANPIIEHIKKSGLNLKGIINTHQHFDHIRGNAPLVEAFGSEVLKLRSAEIIRINEKYSLESLDTPGHTMDHQVFIWKERDRVRGLFSGDTLFNSGVGNCRGGGDVNILYETTRKLIETLPADTILYPGHDYRKRNLEFALSIEPDNGVIKEELKACLATDTSVLSATRLSVEFKVNPFLRLNEEEVRHTVLNTAKSDKEVFIKLRSLRDSW